jgi:hypothetical protein
MRRGDRMTVSVAFEHENKQFSRCSTDPLVLVLRLKRLRGA